MAKPKRTIERVKRMVWFPGDLQVAEDISVAENIEETEKKKNKAPDEKKT